MNYKKKSNIDIFYENLIISSKNLDFNYKNNEKIILFYRFFQLKTQLLNVKSLENYKKKLIDSFVEELNIEKEELSKKNKILFENLHKNIEKQSSNIYDKNCQLYYEYSYYKYLESKNFNYYPKKLQIIINLLKKLIIFN